MEKELNDYYVYAYSVLNEFVFEKRTFEKGCVLYIGSGRNKRYLTRSKRPKIIEENWENISKDIIVRNLTFSEKFSVEQEYLEKYASTGFLINKKPASAPKDVLYNQIRQFVYYDETSPTFLRWKVDDYRCGVYKGSPAGALETSGYLSISICGVRYKQHRVIWCLTRKKDCPNQYVVDHIDGTILPNAHKNNHKDNLRLVSFRSNNINISNSECRSIGVIWDKRHQRWIAHIKKQDSKIEYFCVNPRTNEECKVDKDPVQKSFEIAMLWRKQKELEYYQIEEVESIWENKLCESIEENTNSGICWDRFGKRWAVNAPTFSGLKRRYFKPSKLFPSLHENSAKERAFKLALEYRQEVNEAVRKKMHLLNQQGAGNITRDISCEACQ